jgi:hypothetical protein
MSSASVTIGSDGSAEDLRSLARWLRGEDELKGRVRLVDSAIAPGELGGELEALVLVLSSGTATAFVTSLFHWLGRRRAATMIILRIKDKNGKTVELRCGSADDAAVLLGQIRETLEQ